MAKRDKLLERILSGTGDSNVPFLALRTLLLRLGFRERIRGSHHVFRRPFIEDRINLQRDGHEAKPYQVRQVRKVLFKYRRWFDL